VPDRTATIESWYAAFSRRDEAALLAPIAPEFVADWSRSIGPIHGVYDGRVGLLEMCHSFWELWEESAMKPQDFIESGDAEVIVPIRTYGRGRNGIEVEARSVHV
jgi:ketosteroid isomerase-like protein